MARSRRALDRLRETRLALVRQGICDSIAPFDMRVGEDEQCRVELHSIDLGMVRITCGSGAGLDAEVFRTPRLIRASDPELCKIDLLVRGQAVVEQDDRQAKLGPGAFTFVDLSRPSHLVGGVGGVVAVTFPRSMLPLRHRDAKDLAGVTFERQEPNSALVAALVGQVAARPGEYASPSGVRIGAAILDLITAALSVRLDRFQTIPPDSRQQALLWRVKAFIVQRLSDPRLSPQEVAAAFNISLRYVYRLFESEGVGVGAWIRGRRLEHCRRDLSDPALRDRPVSAIGARWGFADATHFTRVFKAEFGLAPGEFRQLCTRGQGPGTHGRDAAAGGLPA